MTVERARILLIDDERFARQLYSDYLVAGGWDVEVAESAAVALALFSPGRYQVVVTDLLLPDSDGLAILSAVKQADPEVDVIVITGLDRVEPAVRALRGGASDYLVKPVTPDTLQLAVGRALAMRRVLQENAALKESLALLEASQRIAVATDRERVAEGVMSPLLGAAGARAGILFAATADGFAPLRIDGIPPAEQERCLAALVAGPLVDFAANGAVVFDAVSGTDELASVAGLNATLVPLRSNEKLHGVAALFGERMPAPAALRSIEFLAGSAGIALGTIQRFDHVEKLAYLDDLTHLYNSRYLHSLLDRATSGRAGRPFSLMFLDLDHFKRVNDTEGHLVGSRLLVEVAQVLKGCLREGDTCARYGGDEFCVLIPEGGRDAALAIAERIREAIASHRFLRREGLGSRSRRASASRASPSTPSTRPASSTSPTRRCTGASAGRGTSATSRRRWRPLRNSILRR